MNCQDMELQIKAKKTSEKISENMHVVSNDPSLAFYRIQEHVRKVLPPISEKRADVNQLQTRLQGNCWDSEYAVSAIKGIEDSEYIFNSIQESIKTSIFLKQQLKYEENKSKARKDLQRSSVYKRFSAHLALDFPELPDLGGVVRETSQRMETMMTNARNDSVNTAGQGAGGTSAQLPVNATELQRSHTTLH